MCAVDDSLRRAATDRLWGMITAWQSMQTQGPFSLQRCSMERLRSGTTYSHTSQYILAPHELLLCTCVLYRHLRYKSRWMHLESVH